MLMLTLALAFAGGMLLVLGTFLPGPLEEAGYVAWLAALVLVVGQAVGRARREGRSFGATLWLVVKDAAGFVRAFLP